MSQFSTKKEYTKAVISKMKTIFVVMKSTQLITNLQAKLAKGILTY